MLTSIVAGLLRLGPWAAIAAALAISLGVLGALYFSRGRALDAAEALAKTQKAQIIGLQDQIIARAKADLARLAAGQELNVQIQGINDRTTILYRDLTRIIPVDRPCLPVEAVRALNDMRVK